MQKNHSCFKLEELEIKCGKYGVIGYQMYIYRKGLMT